MKLTIVGHFCIDVFHNAEGKEQKKWGGIFHSIAALSHLANDRDVIYPVFGVGDSEYDAVLVEMSVFKNVNTSGIFKYSGESNYVHYYEDGSGERSLNIANPIPYNRIKKFLNVDGVYINMISGSDIMLDTLDEIRIEVRDKKIPVHLDVHCLTLHVNDDGTRFRRPMSDWRRWCFMTDSVQMNEEEAAGISLEKFSDELLAKQMIPLMVKAFVITRGAEGASLFQAEHKHSARSDYKAEEAVTPVSVIGSGDIFGVSFLYAYLKKKRYDDAARFAVNAATETTKYSVSEKHACLEELRAQL
jgi:sugar/nucleoside kinase (ribokinase family)